MAVVAYRVFGSNPIEVGSLAISEKISSYLYPLKQDIPCYEAFPVSSDDYLQEDSFSMSIQIEKVLRYLLNMLMAKIESPSKVFGYLYKHPDIAELLLKISYQIYEYFDFRAQLSLEIQNDDAPDSDYLVIYIRVPEYDDTVMDRVRKIREGYYDLLDNTSGWFLLTTDFAPPR